MNFETILAGAWPFGCEQGVLPCTDDIILWPYAVGICIVAAVLIVGAVVMRKRK